LFDRKWLPLNAMRAFEAVGRHLSFTAAANALSVSQSAVSRHVISLEALLGLPLLERRPGALSLTKAGAALLPVLTSVFDRLEAALGDATAGNAGRTRTLRVHMPPSFAQLLAVPILRDLRREFPDITLDITSPYGVGPPLRDVDAALVFDRPQVGDEVFDLLWMVRVTPVCAPEVARRHAGMALADFLRANELLHVKLDREPRYSRWHAFVRQCGLAVETARGLSFDMATLAAQYALSGEGVALLDVRMFAEDIAAGRLVAPYDTVLEDGYGYFLTIRPEDLADPAIARFRSWIIQRFAAPPAAAWVGPRAVSA
jgi:LysR family glycine cleavage system transcriptional activator